jgi:hypothetical protein
VDELPEITIYTKVIQHNGELMFHTPIEDKSSTMSFMPTTVLNPCRNTMPDRDSGSSLIACGLSSMLVETTWSMLWLSGPSTSS